MYCPRLTFYWSSPIFPRATGSSVWTAAENLPAEHRSGIGLMKERQANSPHRCSRCAQVALENTLTTGKVLSNRRKRLPSYRPFSVAEETFHCLFPRRSDRHPVDPSDPESASARDAEPPILGCESSKLPQRILWRGKLEMASKKNLRYRSSFGQLWSAHVLGWSPPTGDCCLRFRIPWTELKTIAK